MRIAEVGKDRSYSCWMKIESSCVSRQGRGFCCEIYVVSYQNKRFNFTRQQGVGAGLLEYLVYRNL